VVERIEEVADITTLRVVPSDGDRPPRFRPAQCGMVGAFGVGEAAISISSPVTATDHHAYTIRRAGPITAALVDTPVGGTVTVRGPFGRPWPIDTVATDHLVVVGGGLGLAPLRAVLHEAVDRLADPAERLDRVTLAYGARRPDLLVFRADLDRWRDAGVEVALIVDEADGGWSGPVGMVPRLLEARHGPDGDGPGLGVDPDGTDTTAFVCGPDIMMHASALALQRLGIAPDRIWLTLERNMQCAYARCGHCQLGPFIVCRDGPVVRYDRIAPFHRIADL
jgi:NAD(P)H-flavin reductase